jgi:hypothetical protein
MLEVLLGFISPLNVAGVVALAAVVLYVAQAIAEDRKIRSLGGYAPQRKVWLPFGLDIAYNGARSTIEHRVLEYFNEGIFSAHDCGPPLTSTGLEKYANPNRPYTCEVRVGGFGCLLSNASD